jgi:hypothetical protein
VNERKDRFGFAVAGEDPRADTMVFRQRKMQLLILNVRVALGAGQIVDDRAPELSGIPSGLIWR